MAKSLAEANRLANANHFKKNPEDLQSTIGYIMDNNLYLGLVPDDVPAIRVWVVMKKPDPKDDNAVWH